MIRRCTICDFRLESDEASYCAVCRVTLARMRAGRNTHGRRGCGMYLATPDSEREARIREHGIRVERCEARETLRVLAVAR